jgi:pre-mRNA cleavage complex 2 protein Pcf11
MDPFQSLWNDKTQQFVWMDAKKVDGRYFHASCWEEVNGKKKGTNRAGTPILGKRKLAARS